MNQDIITFKHQANAGDLIASLSGIKHLCEKRNTKAIIYQQLNVGAHYYTGATHPVTENERMVMMNESVFNLIKPLIEAQPYIESLEIYDGQVININLDKIRGEVYCGMPNFPIQRWLTYVYPQMQSDISKAWLNCESLPIGISDTILINRTARYQNESINYFFLKNHKCAFIGVDSEYESFTKQWKLNIPHLKVDNFYHLAQLLNACKFFIGNQSMAYNIAEGLKSKRILELCNFAPNCYVTGDNGQEFLHQHGLEYAVQQWS